MAWTLDEGLIGGNVMTFSRLLPILAAGLVMSTGACAQSAPPPPEQMPLAGGWGATTVTPEIEKAAQFALGAMNLTADSLAGIDQAEQQVVAGMNYRMVLTLKDGKRWRVQVYHALDGHYELSNSEPLKPGA